MSAAVTDRADRAKRYADSNDRWMARRLPLLPALFFTIFVTQIPFVFSLCYWLTDWTIDPALRRGTSSGSRTTRTCPATSFFREAAWISIRMTVIAVLLSLCSGPVLAILLDRKFWARDSSARC